MEELDCVNCKNTIVLDWKYSKEEFCPRCFFVINTETAEIRFPTEKELETAFNLYDLEHSEKVINKYWK